jgi:anaerobic magnesium-protoporphyrin IX monomethyl ester cyclase
LSSVVFLQKDVFAKPAFMALSACLKQGGHNCFVVVADLEKDPVAAVLGLNPDVTAFSITTAELPFMRDMGTQLRALCDKTIICGGCHPTFCPDVIHEPYLDAVCRGEGDEAFPEFVNALESGISVENIQNIWVKKEGRVFQNDVRPLINDLDKLPFYDREIYTRYALYAGKGRGILYHHVVNAGRGCPKSCSFCFNKSYNRLYEGKGSVVRRRSVSHLIAELKDLKQSAKLDFVTLDDDSFTLAPRDWLHGFCAAYKKEIGIPFKINSTPAALDEDRVKCLKSAGCFAVKMGIESGNDTIRNKMLQKNLTEESILEAARLLKTHGIRFQTFNIVGSPGESIAMAFETYALNRRIRPDFTWCALLNPYPGTDIYELCRKERLMSGGDDLDNKISFYFTVSPLILPHKREMVNLQKLMNFSVRLNFSERLLRALVKLPLSNIYSMIFGAGVTWGLIRINKGSFWSVVWLSLRYFSRYNSAREHGEEDGKTCSEKTGLHDKAL